MFAFLEKLLAKEVDTIGTEIGNNINEDTKDISFGIFDIFLSDN